MVEPAIVSLLAADADLTAKLGGRIYPANDPASSGAARPRLTYQRISSRRTNSNDGPTRIVTARYDLQLWANEYPQAKALADKVRLLLDGRKGTVVDLGGRAHDVRSMSVTDEQDRQGDAAEGDAKPAQGVRLELRIQYREAAE